MHLAALTGLVGITICGLVTAPAMTNAVPPIGDEQLIESGAGAAAPRMSPQSPGDNAPTESLSTDLSKSKGVIHPPATHDRAVIKPPRRKEPGGGGVIPPPGTPGGHPNLKSE